MFPSRFTVLKLSKKVYFLQNLLSLFKAIFIYTSEISRYSLSDNFKVFYKLILRFLLAIARHAQSTQNNKFATSLQYRKKEVRAEVIF